MGDDILTRFMRISVIDRFQKEFVEKYDAYLYACFKKIGFDKDYILTHYREFTCHWFTTPDSDFAQYYHEGNLLFSITVKRNWGEITADSNGVSNTLEIYMQTKFVKEKINYYSNISRFTLNAKENN